MSAQAAKRATKAWNFVWPDEETKAWGDNAPLPVARRQGRPPLGSIPACTEYETGKPTVQPGSMTPVTRAMRQDKRVRTRRRPMAWEFQWPDGDKAPVPTADPMPVVDAGILLQDSVADIGSQTQGAPGSQGADKIAQQPAGQPPDCILPMLRRGRGRPRKVAVLDSTLPANPGLVADNRLHDPCPAKPVLQSNLDSDQIHPIHAELASTSARELATERAARIEAERREFENAARLGEEHKARKAAERALQELQARMEQVGHTRGGLGDISLDKPHCSSAEHSGAAGRMQHTASSVFGDFGASPVVEDPVLPHGRLLEGVVMARKPLVQTLDLGPAKPGMRTRMVQVVHAQGMRARTPRPSTMPGHDITATAPGLA